jgi:hypothetical protein
MFCVLQTYSQPFKLSLTDQELIVTTKHNTLFILIVITKVIEMLLLLIHVSNS